MLRLLSDENFNADFVRGARLRRPMLVVVSLIEVGLSGAGDPAVLEWAARQNRILLTHDRATMPRFAYLRVTQNLPMPGVFVVNDRCPPAQAIDEILLLDDCSSAEDWRGLVVYLPL